MSLLEVKDISVSFGDKNLFNNGNFDIYKGEHVGLVGENGAGKSTLMKILLNEELPDDGEVIWQKNTKIGYIDQFLKSEGAITVYEYLQSAFKEDFELEKKLNKLYEEMGENYSDALMNKVSQLQDLLEINGFYNIESKIDKVVLGLGISAFGTDTPLNKLSGGQQSKIILARLLLENSDVLLLDEPTNFLDYDHVVWLTEYLKNFDGTFLVISHDVDFLDAITTSILDIEFAMIKKYHGNYNKFLRLKKEYKEGYLKSYEAQQEHIKKTEAYIRKNKAGVNSKMARGRQKQLNRLERIDKPGSSRKPDIVFANPSPIGHLKLHNLSVGYNKALLPDFNLSIEAGDKVVITGFNGIGKSTLLKTIVKEINPISGHIKYSKDINIGYYEQDLKWENENLTALEIVCNQFYKLKPEQIRKHLNKCGIESKDLTQPIHTLSGGEQSKVKLCILILKNPNMIILDEPTNHLDKETKDNLKEALIKYEGTVILVSHEKSFYEDWVDKVYKIG